MDTFLQVGLTNAVLATVLPITKLQARSGRTLHAPNGKPKLLLPLELWEGLQADQRTTLLVHERTHLRGGDHWERRLELIALGLYWWHPAAGWARRGPLQNRRRTDPAWNLD
jgi:hypothetical protein